MLSHGILIGIFHQLTEILLYPVIVSLMVCLVLALWELGAAIAERFITLKVSRWQSLQAFENYVHARLERCDLLSKGGPILGLMGTLIPLGPGLSALNSGNLDILSTAITVAFDTTVVGLLAGLIAFIVARVRRRWYARFWPQLENLYGAAHE